MQFIHAGMDYGPKIQSGMVVPEVHNAGRTGSAKPCTVRDAKDLLPCDRYDFLSRSWLTMCHTMVMLGTTQMQGTNHAMLPKACVGGARLNLIPHGLHVGKIIWLIAVLGEARCHPLRSLYIPSTKERLGCRAI